MNYDPNVSPYVAKEAARLQRLRLANNAAAMFDVMVDQTNELDGYDVDDRTHGNHGAIRHIRRAKALIAKIRCCTSTRCKCVISTIGLQL